MIRLLILLFVNQICVESLIGQIHITSLDFDNLNKQINLYQEDLGTMQSLIIKNKSGEIIKTISIDNEYDPYKFMEFYTGERNFAIIGGRYKFYIVNVSNNKLIGPYYSSCRVEREDAQTGVLNAFKIAQDAQYLFVNALDNGLTCFSLLDLNNPKEVDFYKSDSIFFKGKFVFIDKQKENIFNGFSAECGNYNTVIENKIIFHGYRLELDSLENLKYQITNNNTMILKQVLADSMTKDLIVDLKTGVIINEKEP